MRILYFRWRVFVNQDVIKTFEKLGYTVDTVVHDDEGYGDNPDIERVMEDYLNDPQANYEFVFSMNYFPGIARACHRHGVKYVSWTCDNPLISMYDKSIFLPENYIFAFDKTNYLEFKGMGVENIYYLPLAAETERVGRVITKYSGEKIYAHDISFVGSLYQNNSYDKMSYSFPEYLRGYLDAVIEAQLNISGGNIVEAMLSADILGEIQKNYKLEKSEDSFSDLSLVFQTTILGFKIAQIQRRRGLIELSKNFDVALYTTSNTEDLIRIDNRGKADYWSQMPLIFNGSKINLNFTIPNIKSGIPLRVWDVLGCGGFLLTNFQAEMPYYFENAKHLVYFEDNRELVEKARYYLSHEEERLEIAKNGYELVKSKHSYEARLKEIIGIVRRG